MIRNLFLLSVFALLSSSAFAIDPMPFSDRGEEVRFQKLSQELRCLQCQNQNLADSDAVLAKDMRELVLEQMQAGKSDLEIKQYLVERYGNFVIYTPPLDRYTWLLWLFPFLAFGVLLAMLVRRARRRPAPTDAPQAHEEDW